MSDYDERVGSPADGCGEAALYLLGLLDESHASRFVEHARHCSVCSDELEALAPAADRLAAAVPQLTAPAHVKQRVMTIVHADTADAGAPRARSRPQRRELRLRPAALALAGAALLAAGAVLGDLATPFGGGARRGGQRAGVVSANVQLAGAQAALHESDGHVWLTVAAMPEPSPGHVYEVWVRYPGQELPRATDSLFAPTHAGAATVEVPGGTGAREVLVTQEPNGGSLQPTSPPVIVARVS